MARSNDPFFIVKSEVQKSVSGVSLLYTRLQDLSKRLSEDGGSKDEFTWTLEELNTGIKSIEWDIQDLEQTIKIASQASNKFSITQEELFSRKEFIETTKNTINTIKADVAQLAALRTSNEIKQNRSNLELDRYNKYAALDREIAKDNTNFVQSHTQIQKEHQNIQEEGLQEVSIRLDSIHNLSKDMSNEFTKQNKKLEEFDKEVEKTSGRVTNAIHKVNDLLNKADNKFGYYIIGFLIILLLILVILIIFA